MEMHLKNQLYTNSLQYKMSLDKIIDKYSKLQYQDGGREVDIDNTGPRKIERYMELSKKELSELESKSLGDLSDESALRAQDITTDSEPFDVSHQCSGSEETCVSSTKLSVEDDGIASSDVTRTTVSSLDMSQRTLSETEIQPEDQDDELELSLRNQGQSFVELYPTMISRIKRACYRQQVSEAAEEVLRRYRRWRKQPRKAHVNNTFIVTTGNYDPKKITSKTPLKEMSKSPRTDAYPQFPMEVDTSLQHQSPGRVRGSQRREQYPPILVMDLSASSGSPRAKDLSFNKTFNVTQVEEQPSSYALSPSRPSYPSAKPSLDLTLRHKRLSLATHSPQIDTGAKYPTIAVEETADIYSSPLRQSPFKLQSTSLSRTPHATSRSPKTSAVDFFSREPTRSRSMSTSLSSPPRKPFIPTRLLQPQDSHHLSRSSPHSAGEAGRPSLRRHLSFDSSVPSTHRSFSANELDQDLAKLYHRFVCQSKSSFFKGPPCRFCARSSEATRSHSSSALAALALSPHRSLFRKRHREFSWGSHPRSKRSREEYCTSSPGSKRHGNEMLRRHLSRSEYDGLSNSQRKNNTFHRTGAQQRSAESFFNHCYA